VRSVLLAVFFLALAAISVTLVMVLAVPALVGLFDDPGRGPSGPWQVVALLTIVITLLFAALYAAGLLWLFLACHLFRRDEVEQLLKAGPNTRLELWVFERFSR